MKISKKYNFDCINCVYFIGVGGVSMSALAVFCKNQNKVVLGSDIVKSERTKKLNKYGIKVYYKQVQNNIDSSIDLVVFSGAIKEDNPEIVRANQLNIPIISRGEMLAIVGEYCSKVVAISGTHGKSTTSAMLSYIVLSAGLDACVHIGANVPSLLEFGTDKKLANFVYGKDLLITEACEYKCNFLYTKNYIGVITNVEREHLDYFKTVKNEVKAFKKFAINSKILVLNYNLKEVIKVKKNILYVDLKNEKADVFAKNINRLKSGGYVFDCYIKKKLYARFVINLIGEYNVYNALFAIACAWLLKIDKKVITQALERFVGVERRMQYLGKIENCSIYLDYAHHPTEIENSIKAIMQDIKNDKVLIVFQPHTYSRTKTLFDFFVQVFAICKYNIVFLPTYSAREQEKDGCSCEVLYNAVKKIKQNCEYKTKREFVSYLKTKKRQFDYVFFIGAGDLDKLAKKIVTS